MLASTFLAFLLIQSFDSRLTALAQDKQEKPAPPPEEEIVTVHKGNLVPTLELETTFESVESLEYKPRMETWQGEMTLLKVLPAGTAVRKGDVVLALDAAPIQRMIAATEIDLRVAKATLEKAETEMKLGEKGDALSLLQAETALKDAEAILKSFDKVEGKAMLENARLGVVYSEDGIKDQQEELAQLEKMYKSESLTNDTAEIVVRRTRRALERSKVQLEMTKGEYESVRTVKHPQQRQTHLFTIENAKRSLEALKAVQALGKVQRDAELAKARAASSQAEDLLAKLKRDLEGFSLRAPFDGRVFHGQLLHGAWATADQVAPFLHAGEKLQPGQVLLTVCGTKTHAVADLPEADYFDVTVDQAATVAPSALPDAKRDGTVRSKGSVALPKGQGATAFEATIELKEPFAELLPGMKGKATIKGKELKDVVVVPVAAIATQGGKSSVNVSKDGKSSPREVTVGKSDGKMTQIKTGLEAGEKIGVPK
jgi:HlyD family secretion protein